MEADSIVPLAECTGRAPFRHLIVGTLSSNPRIGCVVLNRPGSANAFNAALWEDFPRAVEALDASASSQDIRVVVVSGLGRSFCAGIDLEYIEALFKGLAGVTCPGRMREQFRRHVLKMQDTFNALERCRLPVIAAVHGSCVGGAVDLIAACDIRVCSTDATFCVKEVDLGIVADMGTLQRLPHIVGHGVAMDLALTARSIGSADALRIGLVTEVHSGGREDAVRGALRLASSLAAKSPLALAGTKAVLLQARDTAAVRDSLEYVATWNSAQLLSEDISVALSALKKRGGLPPAFSKL